MNEHRATYAQPYLPVDYAYIEILQNLITHQRSGKVFFFNTQNKVDEATGHIISLTGDQGAGLFITLDNYAHDVRIDRIITVFGKLGAAYDEYNAFSVCGNGCDTGNT